MLLELNFNLNELDSNNEFEEKKRKEVQEREGVDLTCYLKDKSYNECCDTINDLTKSIFNKNCFSQGDIEFLKGYKEYLTLMNKNIKEGTIQFLNEIKNDFGHDIEFEVSDESRKLNSVFIRVNIKDINESFLFWYYDINKELALYENIYDEKLHNKKIEELKKEVDKISRPSYRTKEAYFYNREMFSTYLYSYSRSEVDHIKALYDKTINTEIDDNKKIVTEVNKYFMEKLLNYYGLEDLNIKYDDINKKLNTICFYGESLRRESDSQTGLYNHGDDCRLLNETVTKRHPFVEVKRKIKVH